MRLTNTMIRSVGTAAVTIFLVAGAAFATSGFVSSPRSDEGNPVATASDDAGQTADPTASTDPTGTPEIEDESESPEASGSPEATDDGASPDASASPEGTDDHGDDRDDDDKASASPDATDDHGDDRDDDDKASATPRPTATAEPSDDDATAEPTDDSDGHGSDG